MISGPAFNWQPIAEYDKTKTKTHAVLLRDGDQWTFGYWGDIVKNQWSDGLPEGAMWRHAQDMLSETVIEFEPLSSPKSARSGSSRCSAISLYVGVIGQ